MFCRRYKIRIADLEKHLSAYRHDKKDWEARASKLPRVVVSPTKNGRFYGRLVDADDNAVGTLHGFPDTRAEVESKARHLGLQTARDSARVSR